MAAVATSRHFAPKLKGVLCARRDSAERAHAHRARRGPPLLDLEQALFVDPATHAAGERAWGWWPGTTTHAPVWWLCGGEEAHGGDGFAPVPALEYVEGDDAIPSREHVEAYGTIGLEYALVLQLPAAGEHGAPAQERDDIMRREHPAAFFAAWSHGEPAFPARRRSNPVVGQQQEVQGRPG
jgi:hypothetical protein